MAPQSKSRAVRTLLVAETEDKAIRLRDAMMSNCDCIGFGSATLGRQWDRIILIMGLEMPYTDNLKLWVDTSIRTRLAPGGDLVVI